MVRSAGKPADFLRIGHRGAAAEAPENTHASFARALELSVDMIECDLQLTADGHVVIIHDFTADRTTSGEGAIKDLDARALRSFDAGSWKDGAFVGERVPTLEETLDQVLPVAALNLELKCKGTSEEGRRLAMAAVAAVRQRDAMGKVVFSSFNPEVLNELREVAPEAPIGVLWHQEDYSLAFEIARHLGAISLHPYAGTLTPEVVATAHAADLAVYTWTENDPERIAELAEMGCDGIISDFPARLLEARALLLGQA
jgi:glycerophosphoryl diester phosphodiesterase